MNAIYGLYATPASAHQAFVSLRNARIPEEKITVLSSEPLEDYAFGSRDRRTVMPWISAVGAVSGLTVGYLLTSWTQQSLPIVTGGMPIVSNWTNMIVMFELTMLGAVLATVLTFLMGARLPGRLPEFYDHPALSSGKILVAVSNPPRDRVSEIEHALRVDGADVTIAVPTSS